jgi:hypothetical protein
MHHFDVEAAAFPISKKVTEIWEKKCTDACTDSNQYILVMWNGHFLSPRLIQ